jgi:MmeI, DNA-methyltransferase domain
VFPPDDPLESLSLAPERTKALLDHLRGLDAEIFAADDSLGWTYQFWRSAEKKEVNDSQVRIGAAELPAVTQLFTEPYMVRFLLHNTLGAWWAGKVLGSQPELARDAADEPSLRAACALPNYAWDYLRFVRDDGVWRPAAGTFPGWPARAAEITLLDPCCGSGHFLTEALAALAALRGVEESLSPGDAVVVAIHDNLHGLEIDGRCVQIAAFALALSAWRIAGEQIKLPTPHVAWVGAPPPLPKSEFVALANGDADLHRGLEALHDLFAQAPLLGSLIEVRGGDLASPMRVARVEESITALVERVRGAEPEREEGALAALGMADAAAILSRRFVLQATNVPFLGRGRQDEALANYIGTRFESAKSDLAAALLMRMRALAAKGGTVSAVTPQNWLFLGSYTKMRAALLEHVGLRLLVAKW